ncbi:tyrosine-protein phosphatase [Microbacterium sp. No. 7]|uniref:tyrosine-protein phosphatase n=1 Tax=Microbacterium sp. No. 7 TaxID=1714373 RepID=UPI0006D0B581|nr:tyrosine-protein phosphatase [Microbacterium sp. No. 7]ALJ21492.1 hypothetical protein AOA12_16985 [Microbacterium sp. No. 7]
MIDGLVNFRDTGGTPLASGGVTRHGVLFRSEALGRATPAGLQAFAESPIGVVVDFRTDRERAHTPDLLPDTRAFRIVELSLLEGAVSELAKDAVGAAGPDVSRDAAAILLERLPALGELYVAMLSHAAESFAHVARLVAASRDEEPSAVLVHCTAGKDRTGIATALLLDAVGATREAIVADYTASGRNLAGPWADAVLASIERHNMPVTPRLRELATETPAEAIEHALAWVESQHDSVAGYLRSGGLSDAELTTLRSRLAG